MLETLKARLEELEALVKLAMETYTAAKSVYEDAVGKLNMLNGARQEVATLISKLSSSETPPASTTTTTADIAPPVEPPSTS